MQKYIDLALALYESDYELRTQHFCFITKNRKILAIGRNKNRFHSLNLRNRRVCDNGQSIIKLSTCAEMNGLSIIKNKTDIKYKDLTLINVRLNRNKEVCLSKLCSSCQSLISFLGIKNVYYSTDSAEFKKFVV